MDASGQTPIIEIEAMWWRSPHNPTAYDDDWEDQPAQSGVHQWGLGLGFPALILGYGIWVLLRGQAQFGGDFPMTLRGHNAIAYGVSAVCAAVFLHCHYFWGNVYNQAWFAVLG